MSPCEGHKGDDPRFNERDDKRLTGLETHYPKLAL
jgi:hypothetical protein